MRKSKSIRHIDSNFPGVEINNTDKYKPLSYYVLGGVDLTGEALKCNASVEHESQESLDEMESKGEFIGIAVASPNVDIFDLAEKVGAEKASTASTASISDTE